MFFAKPQACRPPSLASSLFTFGRQIKHYQLAVIFQIFFYSFPFRAINARKVDLAKSLVNLWVCFIYNFNFFPLYSQQYLHQCVYQQLPACESSPKRFLQTFKNKQRSCIETFADLSSLKRKRFSFFRKSNLGFADTSGCTLSMRLKYVFFDSETVFYYHCCNGVDPKK